MSSSVASAALIAPTVGGPPDTPSRARSVGSPAAGGGSFASLLSQSSAPGAPHFSRHALERLNQRGIELDGQTVERLRDGIGRAATKGSRDSVVFVDATAFVVSVRNNTVVTAVDSGHMRQQVFTNIDSAVIA